VTTKKATNKEVADWATGKQAGPTTQPSNQKGPAKSKGKVPQEVKQEDAKRKRFTVNLDSDLIEWARRASVFTPGLSLSGLVEEALSRELKRLEKERKEPFPKTTLTPKKGRPIVV
jgi:post-segregation antitoxin (ccd killing protein)